MAEDERLHLNKTAEWRRGARNVRLLRSENGFGFTLRHFIVYPPESYQVLARDKRLGLRLSEGRGDEPMETIFVKTVRPGSAAALAGLVTGDRILGVNGEPTVHRPYKYVVSLIQASSDTLNLLVVSREEDIIQLYFGETAHNPETNARPGRLRSPEMHRSPSSKHPALTTPRRSLDTMPQHQARPPLSASSALDYDRPHLSPSPALDRPLLMTSPALERPLLVPSPAALERPPLASSPALERSPIMSASLDYDPRLLDPGSPPLATPGSRLSLDGGSPSRDSRESSVNSVHSSDDSLIISRIIKSCEQKKEFLRRPVVYPQPGGQPPDRQLQPYWSQCSSQPYSQPYSQTYSQPYSQPPERPGGQPTRGRLQAPVWPSAIPASAVPPAAPPSPGPFICGGPVSNPPFPQRQQPPAIRFVSERARQFESGQCHADKIMLYKSELARLGTTNSGANVAVRRREFENRAADWRAQRESRSLDSTTSNSSLVSGSQMSSVCGASLVVTSPVVVHLSGNRTIPVGGIKPHCDPPKDYQPPLEREREIRPRSNSLGAVQRDDGSERRRNKAVRQDSYLAAVKKFVDVKRRRSRLSVPSTLEQVVKRVPRIRLTAPSPTRLIEPGEAILTGETSRPQRPKTLHLTSTYEPDRTDRPGESADSSSTPHSSPGLDSVVRRSKPASLDSQDEDRATRRESYLKATGSDRHMDTDHELSDSEPSYKSISNHVPHCDKDVILEGSLTCKVTLVEGKKSQDRSWKGVWAILRGTRLFLFKDKKDSTSETPVDYERIDMEGVSVNVAEDYSKRRHVLKLSSTCSSEILLQADSSQDMARWLQALHHDNNNTHSLSSVQTSGGAAKNSNSSISKLTPFRNRSPTGQSPTTKSRKPSQSDAVAVTKHKTWKGRITGGLKLKKNVSPVQYPEYPEGATIGVPLDLCPQSNTLEYIPLLVELCTQIVEDKGLDIIGIYRVPGNTAAVSSLTQAVNRGLDSALLDQDQRWSDVNVISSLLKSFFRKLPDCLLTTELYPQFIEADKIDDPRKRVAVLRRLVHELPVHNFNTLRHLMFHLKTVVNHSDINKMEARNLAIVFGPTLIKAGDNNMATLVNDMSHQCRIVETLILYVDWCFSEDELEKLVLREDSVASEIHESESTNQSLLLDNIHKVEAGLKESPTKDMSAKDIVSSIISAANRKMQKARRGKSIVSIAEETLPTPSDQSASASLCESTVKTRDGKTGRGGNRAAGAGKTDTISHNVASHVRQSVIFSGSVTSKILSSNDSQSDKECDVKGEDDGVVPVSKINSVEGGTIRSYTGLQQVTQERVRRFEMETKAMLQRENLRKRDDKESPNTSLTAIGQSIALSKEALDNLGKRLKTCKEGAGSVGSSIRKGSLDSLKDSSWGEWNNTSVTSTDEWLSSAPLLCSTKCQPESLRCSLESLLDFKKHPIFGSTDTLGGDLVVSLTSTFDAKMKDLSVSAAAKEETTIVREPSAPSKELAEDFRDPSLHKSPSNNHAQCKLSEAKNKEGEDNEKEVEVLSDKENCNTKLRRSESLNKREEKKDSSKLRRTESLNKRENKPGSDKLKRSDSLTKNEKTESNLNKRRQLEAGKMYKMKRKTGGINERSIKRRHTVGGTKDFDKVTWLDNRQAEEEEKSRRTSSPDLSRHVLMEVRPWSLIEPTQVLNRPLESHM